ncbi:hypothetical protein Tco_0846198 [Tanacetum coccineum]
MDFPCKLTSIQQSDMESEVSNEEIKRAVWDCGIDKSSGPDGFMFGCNSSFIALIPKIPDTKMVKEFRPISLVGSLYKIIAKILANRLVMVLGDIVNEVQSDFVKDKQILDGPFILNELFQCAFTRASSLSINMKKSKIMGTVVNEDRVEQAALKIRCVILKVWRFTTQKTSLWAWVIKAIHGEDGKIRKCSKAGHTSIWRDIVQEMDAFKKQEDMALKHRYPRLYALELNKNIDVAAKLAQASMVCSFCREPRSGVEHSQLVDLLAKIEGVSLVSMNDRWVWALEGSGDFSVASVRKLLDDRRLSDVSSMTRWIKAVPIKIFFKRFVVGGMWVLWRTMSPMQHRRLTQELGLARHSHSLDNQVDCLSGDSIYLSSHPEQIEGHLSALKSIVKDHNKRNQSDTIRLDFGTEDTEVRENRIVKGKEVMNEDLKKPSKETRRTPLTHRIIEFFEPEYKMSTNIKLYEGTTDSEDHLSRFVGAVNSGEWPMPVWCRMFEQTLDG